MITPLEAFALVGAVGLLVIWGIYPMIMAVLASLASRVPGARGTRVRESGSATPPTSVIIATREREQEIAARVQDALQSVYRGEIEVVVALDPRGEVEIAGSARDERWKKVELVHGDPPGGKAATLNAGVRAASGDILVFTDTHQRFEPDAISALVHALQQDPRLGAVSGNLEIERPENGRSLVGLYWRFERWLRRSEARVHSAIGVTGAIYAMRRELWRPLPADLLLDDVYTPMRLVLEGHRVGFTEDARADETRLVSSTGEYRRKVRTLTGNIQLCVFMPSLLLPWRNPVWLQFLFHKLFRLLTPYLLAVIAAWVVITGAVALEGYLLAVAAALGLLGLWVFKTRSKFGTSVRELLTAGFLMQSAVVVATVNGVRRRWSVWRA